MPPKQAIRGRAQEKGYARQAVEELTSSDNRQVLTAVGLFVVSKRNSSGRGQLQQHDEAKRPNG